ncbi:MAG: hypothetical protein ACYC2K_07405 [Gemmatimonadales bacterium]
MKIKGFIHAKYDEYEREYHFSVWTQDMTQCQGYVLVEEVEIEFTPPPHNVLVNGTIEAYKAEQQKIRAEAESKVNRLQQSINDLLCIEYKPELV